MLKAIIFDYDGVIVDSFPNVFEVYKKICVRFGVSCPKNIEDFRITYGYNFTECLNNLGIGENDFDEAFSIYGKEIIKMKHGTFDDILGVIGALSKKYKLYLVSSSHSEEILPKIKQFGLTNIFEKIYCGADQKIPKSKLLQILLTECNYSPNEVFSIGDRAIDYDSSRKAGLTDENIILVNYGWGLDRSRIGNARVAENPKEILKLIN